LAERTSRRAGTRRFVLALSLLVPLALGAVVVAGFGGTGKSGAAVSPASKCAHGRAARTGDVVTGFPLPGSAIVESISREHGARVVRGHVSGSLGAARDFFAKRLPAGGFELGAGDAETYEAETDFAGHGVRGHLKLNTSFDCPGTVDVAVALR
jgi:hypothetical protein